MSNHRSALWSALAAMLLAFTWQWMMTFVGYGGNWTGLFCTGSLSHPVPEALASERIHVFPNSYGYDGQFYHYMAHDPFLERDFKASIDAPLFRYRRILIPLLAWTLAAGQDRWIDPAYYLVVLSTVFLTALAISRLAQHLGRHPAWGLVALAIPAVAASVDRMTVDSGLAAVVAWVTLFALRGQLRAALAVAAVGCLVRETGMLIPAGLGMWALLQKRWRIAAGAVLAGIPAVAWFCFVHVHAAPEPVDGGMLSFVPFAGMLRRLMTPFPYELPPAQSAVLHAADYAALLGMFTAVWYCGARFRQLSVRPEGCIALAFAALVVFTGNTAVWNEAFAFSRGYSPLSMLMALDAFRSGKATPAAVPLALTGPRVGLQMAAQLLSAVLKLSRTAGV